MRDFWANCRGALKRASALVLLSTLPAMATAWWHPRSPFGGDVVDGTQVEQDGVAPGEVTLAEALTWDSPSFWIDARIRQRFEQEHIPGARSLTEDDWEAQLFDLLAELPADARVVVYCDGQHCDASHAVAERLKNETGLDMIYVLHGGWDAWKAASK